MIYYTLLILTNKQAYIKFNNIIFPLKPRGKETSQKFKTQNQSNGST
jgi:hypothetical protein